MCSLSLLSPTPSKGLAAIVSTPNQRAATASVSRLNKLGSDLDVLSSKLDDIDSRKSKVISRVIQH